MKPNTLEHSKQKYWTNWRDWLRNSVHKLSNQSQSKYSLFDNSTECDTRINDKKYRGFLYGSTQQPVQPIGSFDGSHQHNFTESNVLADCSLANNAESEAENVVAILPLDESSTVHLCMDGSSATSTSETKAKVTTCLHQSTDCKVQDMKNQKNWNSIWPDNSAFLIRKAKRSEVKTFDHRYGNNNHLTLAILSATLGMMLVTLSVIIVYNLLTVPGQVTSKANPKYWLQNHGLVQNFPLCKTDECIRAGKEMYKAINFSVNPCDDFYTFSCGNWISSHSIPEDKSSISFFTVLSEEVQKNKRTGLEKTWKLMNSTRSNSDSVSNSVKFATGLFNECMDQETIQKRDYKPIQQQLNDLLGQWPMLNSSSVETVSDWTKMFVQQFVRFGISPIFGISVQLDANQTDTNRVTFDAPRFGLGRNEYLNQSKHASKVSAYKNMIKDVARTLLDDQANISNSTLEESLEEMFEFEAKLAVASTAKEDRRDASVWYNRMTLNQFKEMTNHQVDWTKMLNQIMNQSAVDLQLTDDDLVVVNDIPYYKNVTELVEQTPIHVLYNYLGWMFSHLHSTYTGPTLRNMYYQFLKHLTGVEKQPKKWISCIQQIDNEIPFAVSRVYVDEYVQPATKLKASRMINNIKQAFRGIVMQDTWLDQTTRRRALKKLDAITDNIAYPDWLLDNTELDKFHGINSSTQVLGGQYFESILLARRRVMHRTLEQLKEPVNATLDWPISPAIVNAAYLSTKNSITIPAGILNMPFFDPSRPVVMNYGGIGSVIGHEITHGFDDQGRQFGKSGNLREWWTEETKQRFDSKSKCFINQYGSITDSKTNKKLNGRNTVGENIADNGGIREAYLAYKSYARKNPRNSQVRIPYLSKFSPEQIFFLSYANIWCGDTRPEMQEISIDYNPHSPKKYRVNVVLGNFDRFSQAFGCPKESPMNFKDKCVLW